MPHLSMGSLSFPMWGRGLVSTLTLLLRFSTYSAIDRARGRMSVVVSTITLTSTSVLGRRLNISTTTSSGMQGSLAHLVPFKVMNLI